jgi:hypothetical protein
MIAGSPRKHVRLLGLASRSWPRRSADDPLLPKHVLGDVVLQERTLAQTDRAHFAAILERSDAQVVLSRARRGADGRKLAPSPLLRGLDTGEEVSLMPRRLPEHAFSEGDRRLARPRELAQDEHARSALATWRAWQQDGLTAHDGIVPQAHPAIARAPDRVHSATSLRALLRNPIAFVWRYAFGWSEPSDLEEGLVLDPLQRGTLLHETLEEAVRLLEAGPGLAHASDDDVSDAAQSAVRTVAEAWSIAHPVPPQVLWLAALEEARLTAEMVLGVENGLLYIFDAAADSLPVHSGAVRLP